MSKAMRKPYSPAQLRRMQEKKGRIHGVLAVPLSLLLKGIDDLNDFASETVTGSAAGLDDIAYELAGVNVAKQVILLEVAASAAPFLAECDGQ